MKKILQSRLWACIVFIFVLVALVVTFIAHNYWWELLAVFFAFMMSFSHLVAVFMRSVSGIAAQKLEKVAFITGDLALVAYIAQFVVKHFVI